MSRRDRWCTARCSGVPGVGVGARARGLISGWLVPARRACCSRRRCCWCTIGSTRPRRCLRKRAVVVAAPRSRARAGRAEPGRRSRRGAATSKRRSAHQRAAMALYARSRGGAASPMARLRRVRRDHHAGEPRARRRGAPAARAEQRQGARAATTCVCSTGWPSSTSASPRASTASTPTAPRARAAPALTITGAAALLGLCAWAHWKSATPTRRGTSCARRYDRRQGGASSARCRGCRSGWRSTPRKPSVGRVDGADDPSAVRQPFTSGLIAFRLAAGISFFMIALQPLERRRRRARRRARLSISLRRRCTEQEPRDAVVG